MVSLETNPERIKQRQEEIMKKALRARKFSAEVRTREISEFMKFALSLKNIKIIWSEEDERENED